MHLLKSFIAKSATIFSHIHIAWYAHFPPIALFFSLMPDCRQSTMQIKLVLVTFILQSLGRVVVDTFLVLQVGIRWDWLYLKQSWWIWMIIYHRFFQIRKKKLLSTCESFVFFSFWWQTWSMFGIHEKCACDVMKQVNWLGRVLISVWTVDLWQWNHRHLSFHSISEYIFFRT